MQQHAGDRGMERASNSRLKEEFAEKEARSAVPPCPPRRLLGTELASEAALAEDWLSDEDEKAWADL